MKTPPKTPILLLVFLFLSLFCMQTNSVFSQNYTKAVGLKIGGYPAYNAIDYKGFMADNWSFDAALGISPGKDSRNVSLQCIFAYNHNIGRNTGFNWYVGGGPSLSYWINGVPPIRSTSYNTNSKLYTGINTVGGVEYSFDQIPLNVAFDAGPSVILFPSLHVNIMANISLRYILRFY